MLRKEILEEYSEEYSGEHSERKKIAEKRHSYATSISFT